jgi:4-aminobutyrate aminotransferase
MDLSAQFQVIGDVRGLGLMDAVEFTKDGQPDAVTTKAIVAAALEGGLILLTCGTFDNVVRWIPPLVVSKEEIDLGVDIFAKALEKVVR